MPRIHVHSLHRVVWDLIREAKETIVIASDTWPKPNICLALEQAARRGVEVKLVVDARPLGSSSPDIKGVEWKAVVVRGGAMHHKLVLIDGEDPNDSKALTGSFNVGDSQLSYNLLLGFNGKSHAGHINTFRAIADVLWTIQEGRHDIWIGLTDSTADEELGF